MLFFEGFPRVTHADDLADSPVLNGMMVLVDHPLAIPMHKYSSPNNEPVRFPAGKSTLENNPRCFSRDQTILYVAGFAKQYGKSLFRPRLFAPNDMDEVTLNKKQPDMFSPSAYSHLKRCYSGEASFLGNFFLKIDCIYNGLITPLREQNQLQAMVLTAGAEYVKFYCKWNPKWREATKLYWCDDRPNQYNRGEPELAEMIIRKIEEVCAS